MLPVPDLFERHYILLLTVVFFVETTPDDLWHSLAHHQDTREITTSETILSIHHIHCDCLQNTLPFFHFQNSIFNSSRLTAGTEINIESRQRESYFVSVTPSGRAPPALT